jgi:hypothetical protein
MMFVFESVLPEPLNEQEKSRFEQMYLKQPHFGQMPFVLLNERFSLLDYAHWDIAEEPNNRSAIATFHRLLAYYGEMVPDRRKSDRTIKGRNVARDTHGYAGECELNPEIDQEDRPVAQSGTDPEAMWSNDLSPPSAEPLAKVGDLARQRSKIRCACADPTWDCRVFGETDQTATLMHRCDQCGFTAPTEISIEEFRRVLAE